MKKGKTFFFGVFAIAGVLFASCEENLTGISLQSDLLLALDETFTLDAYPEPWDAPMKEVSWRSSDSSVATVDPSTGEVTAIKVGFAVITASANEARGQCRVRVIFDVLKAIPDSIFLGHCHTNLLNPASGQGWDLDNNGRFTPDEAAAVSELMMPMVGIGMERISSLEGLEFFTGLTRLNVVNGGLSSIDLSKNTKLTQLECEGNPGEDGVFVVQAWFDNDSVPVGRVPNDPQGSQYHFPRNWEIDGVTVTVDYQKVD